MNPRVFCVSIKTSPFLFCFLIAASYVGPVFLSEGLGNASSQDGYGDAHTVEEDVGSGVTAKRKGGWTEYVDVVPPS